MSCWNHRVRKRTFINLDGSEEIGFDIVEAHYENQESAETHKQCGFTVDGIDPYGETLEELKEVLEWMLKALDKPIIDDGIIDCRKEFKQGENNA